MVPSTVSFSMDWNIDHRWVTFPLGWAETSCPFLASRHSYSSPNSRLIRLPQASKAERNGIFFIFPPRARNSSVVSGSTFRKSGRLKLKGSLIWYLNILAPSILTYFFVLSVPPGKPPILLRSTKGTTPQRPAADTVPFLDALILNQDRADGTGYGIIRLLFLKIFAETTA